MSTHIIPFFIYKSKKKQSGIPCIPGVCNCFKTTDPVLNYFLASSDFCHLLVTSANSLDPDQDRQNVSPDLDSNILTI